jgi:hypothetical protein
VTPRCALGSSAFDQRCAIGTPVDEVSTGREPRLLLVIFARSGDDDVCLAVDEDSRRRVVASGRCRRNPYNGGILTAIDHKLAVPAQDR